MAYQPTAGDRVRLRGIHGPRAVIIELHRMRDGKPYWKAKRLDNGELEWPNQVIADCDGAHSCSCTDCEIVFFSDTMNDPLCPNCDRRLAAHDPGTRRRTGARTWRA